MRLAILALTILAIASLSGCEQLTGVKPAAVPCPPADTIAPSDSGGTFTFRAPKYGCLNKTKK